MGVGRTVKVGLDDFDGIWRSIRGRRQTPVSLVSGLDGAASRRQTRISGMCGPSRTDSLAVVSRRGRAATAGEARSPGAGNQTGHAGLHHVVKSHLRHNAVKIPQHRVLRQSRNFEVFLNAVRVWLRWSEGPCHAARPRPAQPQPEFFWTRRAIPTITGSSTMPRGPCRAPTAQTPEEQSRVPDKSRAGPIRANRGGDST